MTLIRFFKKKKFNNIYTALINKNFTCNFFINFLDRCKNFKLKEILTLNKLVKQGIEQKICPFYLSRHFLIISNIIIGDIKNIILNDNFNLISKKQTRNGFLILDNIYQISGIDSEYSCFQLNRIITENSERGILLIKKKILKKMFLKKKQLVHNKLENYLNEKIYIIPTKYLNLINKIKILVKDIFTSWDSYFFFYFLKLGKKHCRILHLVEIVHDLILRIKEILKFKGIWRWNMEKFFKYLVKNSDKIEFSIDSFAYLPKEIYRALESIGILETRQYSGIIKLSNFFKIISSCEESINDNFQFFIISSKQKFNILSESTINLMCKESTILIRFILEKFKSVIFISNSVLNHKIVILLLDCKPLIYGFLKNFNLKNHILPILINLKRNKLIKIQNFNEIEENTFNFYFTFINQALSIAPEASLIFVPKTYKLDVFIEKLKKNKVLKKILLNRKIFIESDDFKTNIILVEEFKLTIDLGNKCLFLGFYGGILYQANLSLNYKKIVFALDNPIILNNYLSSMIKEKIYLTEKIKKNEIWNSCSTFKESGYIINKFFKSKKGYEVFIKMSNVYKIKDSTLFSLHWELFDIFEKESKINSIILKIKNFFNNTI